MRENFIKQLSAQPSQNFGNQNTKINVHFPVRGELLEYCMAVNSEIQKITKSGVDFSPTSFQIPHLTLYMGFAHNQRDFDDFFEVCYDFSKELTVMDLVPTVPYLKGPKNNYAFIDVNPFNDIISLKERIKKSVDNFIEPLNWDVVSETPHITVGYIKENANEVMEMLKEFNAPPSFKGNALEISFSGAWGSCLGALRAFEINPK